MTLLEKLNKELNVYDLEFIKEKESNFKFTGILRDTETKTEVQFEVWKSLQWNKMKSHAEWCRSYMDNYIFITNLQKGGKQ